jgi:DNA-binding Lrp family transcriptional regulator
MKNTAPLVDSAIPQQSISLDEKDLAILRLLQENARITVKEIADQIHLSTTPVHERIKRLEAGGVIKQYATLIDGTKVKKGLMVICYVSLNQHSKQSGGYEQLLQFPRQQIKSGRQYKSGTKRFYHGCRKTNPFNCIITITYETLHYEI